MPVATHVWGPGGSARRCWSACATCFVITFSACGFSDRTSPTESSTVTVLFEGDEWLLGPAADDGQKFLMFLPLVRGYAHEATDRLAERWEHSPDYRTWTFYLRDDVRWHDGVPVTAHDVVFSLELFTHPDVLFPTDFLQWVESFSAPDDHTFTIRWTIPRGPSDALPGWTVFYPKHVLEGLDPGEFYQWDFWTRPIGNGPYRYVRHVPKTMMELEANPDFYAGEPTIARVVLKFSTANKLIELTSGNVDAILNVNHSDVPRLEADPRFGVYHVFAFTEPQALLWNHRHPLLSDPIVRRALWQAIDRRELLEILDFPEETPVLGGLFAWERTGQLLREGRLDEGFAYDPEVARELLERAGWLDPDGDGTRERNGVEARFTLLASSGGLVSIREPSVFIQDQLRNVGVEMEIHTVSASVAREAYRSGDFDAVIGDVPNVPEWLLQRDWFGESSRIGYVSPEIIRLLEALTVDLDPNSQDSLYARINEILHRDMPFTLLFPWVETFAAHSRIRGLSTPDRGHPLMYMDELWLEGER